MKKFFQEFRDFAVQGNVVDLAIAVVIGGAFGKIVTSFVNDILMPPIGIMLGGLDFKNLKLVLKDAVDKNPAITLNYGNFIQMIVDFLIISFFIFIAIKAINSAKKHTPESTTPPPPAEPTNSEKLLAEIRDLLKK
ncbi:MAG: large-conductance mechanosensitive channel protein MscL [Cytophagales bacterium]|nr:MAG: large-conductance mechanosensitive channel protein MscL [Cytophagales bacterium]